MPEHTPGIQAGEPDLKMGHRGQITADIFFDNVAVAGVGVAQAALDLAVARLRSRELFGRKLGEMQYWQYKLA